MPNDFQFHEEQTASNRQKENTGGYFGITKLLLKNNLVETQQQAKQLSVIIMIAIVIISAFIVFITNTGDSIPEESRYDPTTDIDNI